MKIASYQGPDVSAAVAQNRALFACLADPSATADVRLPTISEMFLCQRNRMPTQFRTRCGDAIPGGRT